MEFIIDTADVTEIKKINDLLTIDGVTTNPSIVCKSGKDVLPLLTEIASLLRDDQKFFVQVIASTCDEIVEEAKVIAGIKKKEMYVKIPVSYEGLKAIKKVRAVGIGVLATAIYSSEQGFLAAKSGANYVAPYVNRMDNYGDGVSNTLDLVKMIDAAKLDCKVIAASFKNTRQVHELIKGGCPAVTLPIDVVYAMIDHPGTSIAIDQFEEDWQKTYHRSTLF